MPIQAAAGLDYDFLCATSLAGQWDSFTPELVSRELISATHEEQRVRVPAGLVEEASSLFIRIMIRLI
ncbi:hypothetical protein PDESU_01862 [Pontiella desulfatans]|uniref:Uncharacterized protein n=2 Tax=Pontiella desulfatans TaxID=2750659 RepID=A0A6C2U1P8_PONDE|nr:hypothetical protein PDESU_01862 [Pontiella desulfatans]